MVARTRIPPPPVTSEDKTIWNNWYVAVKDAINSLRADLAWANLDFTGSNITDIQSRSHQNLQNLQGGSSTERYHLTAAQVTSLTFNRLTGYTVATLPAGTQGDKAFVTDALAPTYLVTVVGGGAVVTEVFYNGTNWVCT